MTARIRPRNALLGVLGAIALLFGGSAPPAQADPADVNLPIYTSPIDVTGLKLQLRLSAPDRETGKPIDVTLPAGSTGPQMNQIFSTPLSTQIDQYWNTKRDPVTGLTPRAAACEGKGGIKEQVAIQVAKIGSSYSAYGVSCNLATTGQLLAKQVGSTMYLGYLLTNNTVTFTATSPDTCHAGSGTPVCPNDPRFTVHFATELVTVIRTPGLCALTAENGTVSVVSASIDSRNGAAAAAKFFKGQKFLAAEVAMTNVVRNQPLPIDAAFAEMRTSGACTGKLPGVSRILSAFRDLETVIDMRQGIILRASHVGIATPALDAPNPGAATVAQSPRVPSFTRPTISTTQPLVTAGTTLQTTGRYFPPNTNVVTTLPVTLRHGGYGPNSEILGGVCFGGATEIQSGPAGGALRVQRFPGDAQGKCVASYDAANLTPNTTYQFRARDCDPITCSPWSATLRSTTAKTDAARGKVILTLDGGTPLGSATVSPTGTFLTPITIPPGTPAGARTIHAVDGDAKADVTIQVAAPSAPGRGTASIMMVGLLKGETGCPNHPISSTQTDDTFTLFGSGFAPGSVTIHLDRATGLTLGTVRVRDDGSICRPIQSAPASQAGPHTLVAVQNGAAVAQTAVTFVLPSGVR